LLVLLYSLTYFIYDTSVSFYYNTLDKFMLIHHVCCILAELFVILNLYGVNCIFFGMALGEISNLTMHIRE